MNNPVVKAGGSCTYNVTFIPVANQNYSGTLTVEDGITNPVVTLAGAGVPATGGSGGLVISPSPINITNVIAGGNGGTGSYTLTNTTSQTITLLSTTASSPNDELSVPDGLCFASPASTYLPAITVTLAPGASCSDYVQYSTPVADEHLTGTLNFTYETLGAC